MLRLEPVVQLARPTSIVQRPTTMDAYVTSVGGELVRVPLTGGTGTVVANVADLISTRGESGLLDLAFDATGNLLYLSLVERNGDLVVWEVPMVGGQPAVVRWREVIRVPGRSNIHHAGDIYIDAEGLLWFAVGDGDPNDSVTGRAQDLTDLRGKLLRLDPRPQPDGRPYGIPPGNPFLGRTDARPEIWSFGLRNPWRFSIDEPSGSLWIGDVGRYAAEEVNFASGPAVAPGPTSAGPSSRAPSHGWMGGPGSCPTTARVVARRPLCRHGRLRVSRHRSPEPGRSVCVLGPLRRTGAGRRRAGRRGRGRAGLRRRPSRIPRIVRRRRRR